MRPGQLLARFESSEQETTQSSAEADVSSAKSDLATAEWNLDQSKDLFKAGAIAERDLKVAEQTVESAKARLAAANARSSRRATVARHARRWRRQPESSKSGWCRTASASTRGQQLFSLVRNDALELAAAVPAKQATSVAPGQVVHFVADARSFDGRVARVSPTIDPTTRAVTVYVQVPNRDGALKGGTFASGRVVQRTISGAIVVPTPALRQSQENGQTFVYRVANRAVDAAQIQLGVIDERAGKAEVLSGLNEGDRVIVGNVGILGRGMQVTVLGSDDQGGAGGGRRGGRQRRSRPRRKAAVASRTPTPVVSQALRLSTMFLSDVSIKRPVFATMMMLALVVLGIVSYQRLAIDEYPDVTYPTISVSVDLSRRVARSDDAPSLQADRGGAEHGSGHQGDQLELARRARQRARDVQPRRGHRQRRSRMCRRR